MEHSKLSQLLSREEGLKLEFKQELDLGHPSQWNELVKDIVALTNGNVRTAGETGYVIVGAGDKLRPDGTRELFDTREQGLDLDRQRIIQKVNTYCNPPIPDLLYHSVEIEGCWLAVIEIPPSPHVHEIGKRLRTPGGKYYARGTVLVRRAEGIQEAIQAEIEALKAEKRALLESDVGQTLFSPDDWQTYRVALARALESERVNRFMMSPLVAPIERGIVLDQPMGLVPTESESAAPQPWIETAIGQQDTRSSILLGEPGAGKSVCLNQLAGRLLEQYERPSEETGPLNSGSGSRPLPIPVRLIEYLGSEGLDVLIARALQRHRLGNVSPAAVQYILDGEQPLIVLADGLDEAGEVERLIAELSRLIAQSPRCRLIVSCREARFEDFRYRLEVDRVWRLAPLDEEDVKAYLEQHLKEGPPEDAAIAGMIRNPLFLHMYADLVSREGVTNRFDLLRSFIGKLHRREHRKHLRKADRQTLDACDQALGEAAFEMHRHQTSRLAIGRFSEITGNAWLLLSHGIRADLDSSILDFLPIVDEHEDGTVSFSHAVFQDYYAARYLSRMDLADSRGFVEYAVDARWDYAVVLLAESLPDSSQLIDSLMYAVPDGVSYDLVLRCLSTARRVSKNTLECVMRGIMQGGLPGDVLRLEPFVAVLPKEEQEEWAAAVAEAFLRAYLAIPLPPVEQERWTELLFFWHEWAFPLHQVFRTPTDSGLRAHTEMVRQVAIEAMQSHVETERVGGVFLAAAANEWDKVAGLAGDTSTAVRKAVIFASCFLDGDGESARPIEILEMLADDPDDQIGRLAINGLCDDDHPAATDFLIRLVEGEDRGLAQRVVTELRRTADEEFVLRLWSRVHAGQGGEGTRQLVLELTAEQDDYYQDPWLDRRGELFLAWAMPDFSVDTDWILDVIDDVGAIIIDWWEQESKLDYHWDLHAITDIILATPGSRVNLRTARSSWSQPVGYDLLYEMMRGLLVVDHYRPVAAADLALSAMIQSHPTLLADLALPKYSGTHWSCSVVVAGLAWMKIESLLSAPGAIFATMPGMRNVIDHDEMNAALKDAVPASLIRAWHTFDLPKPSFIESENGVAS